MNQTHSHKHRHKHRHTHGRPRPPQATFAGEHLRFAFDAELSTALQQLGRAHGATLFMTLLALFQALLHTYSGQDDLCVATSIAGRSRTEFEGLVGFFINRLILRARAREGREPSPRS